MKSKNMHCTNNKVRETKINKETSTNQPLLPLSANTITFTTQIKLKE